MGGDWAPGRGWGAHFELVEHQHFRCRRGRGWIACTHAHRQPAHRGESTGEGLQGHVPLRSRVASPEGLQHGAQSLQQPAPPPPPLPPAHRPPAPPSGPGFPPRAPPPTMCRQLRKRRGLPKPRRPRRRGGPRPAPGSRPRHASPFVPRPPLEAPSLPGHF